MEKNVEELSKEYYPDIKAAIDTYKEKGFDNMKISIAFGKMYRDDVINYPMLKYALGYLGFTIKADYDNLTDEERKELMNKMLTM